MEQDCRRGRLHGAGIGQGGGQGRAKGDVYLFVFFLIFLIFFCIKARLLLGHSIQKHGGATSQQGGGRVLKSGEDIMTQYSMM